jgi:hypothetical protein
MSAEDDEDTGSSNAPGLILQEPRNNQEADDEDNQSYTSAYSVFSDAVASDGDWAFDEDDDDDPWEVLDTKTILLIVLPILARVAGRRCGIFCFDK